MPILLLKLLLAPLAIVVASLAQRRWGAAFGGWLVGLPLTSGPISVFFLVEHGPAFAATAARGTLGGTISGAAFCLVYAGCSLRARWGASLAAASVAFFLATAALRLVAVPTPVWTAAVLICLWLALRLLRNERGHIPDPAVVLPAWDIPARAVVATAFVLTLTGAAEALGPTLSGLLSPFPIYAGVMMAFTHAHGGRAPARATARGVIVGLFAFTAFFTVVSATIDHWPGAASFAVATGLALSVEVASMRLVRPPTGGGLPAACPVR